MPFWSANKESMFYRFRPVAGSGTGISRLINSYWQGLSGGIYVATSGLDDSRLCMGVE